MEGNLYSPAVEKDDRIASLQKISTILAISPTCQNICFMEYFIYIYIYTIKQREVWCTLWMLLLYDLS